MTHSFRIAAVVLLAIAATTVASARADVKAQKDPNFDFTKLKTFGWKTPAGDVKIWVTKDSNSRAEPARRTYEPVLIQAAATEFTKRGYAASAGVAPDFELAYFVLIAAGMSSQQMGQFLPTNATWGIPMFAPQTSSLEVYPEGSIVLDASLPAGGAIVWRGIVQSRVLEGPISEAERTKRIQGFMKQLVSKFPERKK